jgi:hypothetical protein
MAHQYWPLMNADERGFFVLGFQILEPLETPGLAGRQTLAGPSISWTLPQRPHPLLHVRPEAVHKPQHVIRNRKIRVLH